MRNPWWLYRTRGWKLGTLLFTPKHVKSEDRLFAKYKKPKNHPRISKKIKSDQRKPAIIIKSAAENINQCLQTNGNLIFAYCYSIYKTNLETMKTTKISFPMSEDYTKQRSICAIPDQKMFGIDFVDNSLFIINKNLDISKIKRIEPKTFGPIIYLDGLIYLFTSMDYDSRGIETYDLNNNRWKKAATIKKHISNRETIIAVYEGKIIIAPFKGSLKAFDPFCNSVSKILKLEKNHSAILLVANDKLYCIQCEGYIFESLPRDYTQWICISKNSIVNGIYGMPLYSLYNDSLYFLGIPYYAQLYEFNLKTRTIKFLEWIY